MTTISIARRKLSQTLRVMVFMGTTVLAVTACSSQKGPSQSIDTRGGTIGGNVNQTQGNTSQSAEQSVPVTLNLALDPTSIGSLFGQGVPLPFRPTESQVVNAISRTDSGSMKR